MTALAIGHTNAVLMTSHMMFLFLVVLRLLFRHTWIAVGMICLLSVWIFPAAYSSFPLHAVTLLTYTGAYLFILFRFGFLALVTAASVSAMFATVPFTADPTSWVFGGTLVAVAIALGVAFYGFRAALAGRPIAGGGGP